MEIRYFKAMSLEKYTDVCIYTMVKYTNESLCPLLAYHCFPKMMPSITILFLCLFDQYYQPPVRASPAIPERAIEPGKNAGISIRVQSLGLALPLIMNLQFKDETSASKSAD